MDEELEINLLQIRQLSLVHPGSLGPDAEEFGGTGSAKDPEDLEHQGPDDWRVRIEMGTGNVHIFEVPNKKTGHSILAEITDARQEAISGNQSEDFLLKLDDYLEDEYLDEL